MIMFISPTVVFNIRFVEYLKEFSSEEQLPYPHKLNASDYLSLILRLKDYSEGEYLPKRIVFNGTYCLVQDKQG